VRRADGATTLPPGVAPGGLSLGLPGPAPYTLVITAPAQESRHWLKGAGAVLGVLLLPVRSWLSSRLEADTSDHFVQFLGGLGHLVQLSGNRVEISGRRSTRAIQIIDVDHALDPIDGAISVIPTWCTRS
jgi:hypothetical protein